MSAEESDEHHSPHSSTSFSQPSSSSYGTTYQHAPPSPSSSRRHEEDKRMSLEERHQQMNSLFGIKPFKSHISRRRVGDRSPELQELYDESKTFVQSLPGMNSNFYNTPLNLKQSIHHIVLNTS